MRRAVGQADGGAEIHEGLVKVAGRFSCGVMGCEGVLDGAFHGCGSDVLSAGEYAHDDAQDIAVDCGQREAESDGADGTGCVAPDAGELQQGIKISRHLAMEGIHQDDGSFFEVAGPAVVAESLPEFHERFLLAGCKSCDVGEGRKEAVVVGDDGRSSCLLEHDF